MTDGLDWGWSWNEELLRRGDHTPFRMISSAQCHIWSEVVLERVEVVLRVVIVVVSKHLELRGEAIVGHGRPSATAMYPTTTEGKL